LDLGCCQPFSRYADSADSPCFDVLPLCHWLLCAAARQALRWTKHGAAKVLQMPSVQYTAHLGVESTQAPPAGARRQGRMVPALLKRVGFVSNSNSSQETACCKHNDGKGVAAVMSV
jgi:hypothetical protein